VNHLGSLTVADEIQLTFVVPGTPDTVLAQWKQDRPAPIRDYEIADEAYDALTFETHYYDWIWKIMFVVTFGVALLFKSFARSVWRFTARFDAEGGTRTKVTILGKAPEQTRAELSELAAQNGGPVGLRVGV
jgi:hypothetical protein